MRTMHLVIGLVSAALLIAPVSAQASLGNQPIRTVQQISTEDSRNYLFTQMMRLREIEQEQQRYNRAIETWQRWAPIR
ncbi:hypothetical protein HYT05_03630 [Candidatus Kaiserbacteria bacterium]|nr:hypothetical protein [Candidatus Kaiserbacteria bacterium]